MSIHERITIGSYNLKSHTVTAHDLLGKMQMTFTGRKTMTITFKNEAMENGELDTDDQKAHDVLLKAFRWGVPIIVSHEFGILLTVIEPNPPARPDTSMAGAIYEARDGA